MRNVTLFLLWLIVAQAYGQESRKTQFFVGYYGETLTHTGATIGMEYSPLGTSTYQMLLSANAGGYIHRRNNTSIFVRGQWGQRVTLKSRWFVDNFLGIGYLHHFTHGGDTYEVLPNGSVVQSPDHGRPKFMPSIALGLGYALPIKDSRTLRIYVRPECFWKAPFNGYYLTHFALNSGVIFQL